MSMRSNTKAILRAAMLPVVLGLCLIAAPSSALASGPKLTLHVSAPDSAQAGEKIAIAVAVQNIGDERSTGPIVMTDTVGAGMTPAGLVEGFEQFITTAQAPFESSEEEPHEGTCKTEGATLTCTVDDALPPGAQLDMRLDAGVKSEATGTLTNKITASAGNVAPVTFEQQIAVGGPRPFGLAEFGAELHDSNGEPLTQAGSDPADFTTTVRFVTVQGELFEFFPVTASVEHFKDVLTHLPVGLIGNPTASALCTPAQLAETTSELHPECPIDSQIGVVHVALAGFSLIAGLYNLTPPPGAASELGFEVLGTVVPLDAYLRPDDSGIDILSRDTSTTVPITEVNVTVWGNPASHSHDRYRGQCLGYQQEGPNGHLCPSSAPEKAFLRMPTSCSGGGLPFGAQSNSYEHPERFASASFAGPVLTGCERVPFTPNIQVVPTAKAANSPTGVAVQLSEPQNSNPEGLGEADLKKAVVTLPEGMAVNPSAADGLQACSDAQLRVGLSGPAQCPDASKIGTVVLHTPLLENPVEGSVYVLSQESSDPESGRMFRVGMELRDDRHGVDVKVPGEISLNKATGRITTAFDDNPQLPFNDITLHFKSGARAPLTTPASCSAQTTEAELYPWSEPNTPAHADMTFDLTSGPEGAPCASPWPFDPGFNAGVTSVQAGGFTPFLATFSRKDVDQSMQRVSVTMPKGLLGSLVGLPLCPEAQANAGTCGAASEIGTVTAGAGDGPTPFYVTGGHVYMTGPYEGAPFGLSVVVPAKAGPFDLGTVVVRAKVEVDVHTAQLTVTTDPLPQIVSGVPVNLRLVNVTINRPNFTYNPTDCEPSEVAGTMTGGQGAVAHVASHFQVTNCGALRFQPRFSVSTSGRTSRAKGASLAAKLVYPKTPQGTEANIAKVKVSLPKQLPSRLRTLQKACPAQTFEADPAACPAASRIGSAQAVTPVLPVPLDGPVYFVSHGGEAFPDLVVVLQGYGVTVELVGSTFISKGITSTTFKQVPDVPVGSFELKLPQGPDSALAANGNLCASRLKMPTVFVGQDGAEIHTSTPIRAVGCARHKPHHKRHKHKRGSNHRTHRNHKRK